MTSICFTVISVYIFAKGNKVISWGKFWHRGGFDGLSLNCLALIERKVSRQATKEGTSFLFMFYSFFLADNFDKSRFCFQSDCHNLCKICLKNPWIQIYGRNIDIVYKTAGLSFIYVNYSILVLTPRATDDKKPNSSQNQ